MITLSAVPSRDPQFDDSAAEVRRFPFAFLHVRFLLLHSEVAAYATRSRFACEDLLNDREIVLAAVFINL